ncbi:MAG TPA: hypothetical protein VHB21_08785 [Minicystis sp.]|nr:hypothetical protein [Minicystis sp.]
MLTRLLAPLGMALFALTAACGGGGSSGSSSGAGGSSGSGIPAAGPGDDVDNDFKSAEPNDAPDQATQLGTAMGPDVYVWVSGNAIGGGADAADYFVFQSGGKPGQFSLGMSGLCFTGSIQSMTATLWKVSGGAQVMPPVHTWTSTDACVTSSAGDAPIEANTEYLLGVTASGGAGTYAA